MGYVRGGSLKLNGRTPTSPVGRFLSSDLISTGHAEASCPKGLRQGGPEYPYSGFHHCFVKRWDVTKSRTARGVKGTLVSAVAAIACYWMWASLLERADEGAQANGCVMGAGWFESLLAMIAGLLSMPVLLWVGRACWARGNHLLVLFGTVAWLFIGGHVVDGFVSDTATAVFLALFVVLAVCCLWSNYRGSEQVLRKSAGHWGLAPYLSTVRLGTKATLRDG